jgi:hypothetical protein
MNMKLPGNAKKPGMDTGTGTGRGGQQIVKELWKVAGHSHLSTNSIAPEAAGDVFRALVAVSLAVV